MPVWPPQKPSYYYDRVRSRGRLYSGVMHLLFVVIAIVGLPTFFSKPLPDEPAAVSVEILPISAISNIKPAESVSEPKKEDKKPEPKKPSPPVKTTEAPPPPPPEKMADKPKEKVPDPKKEEKKPEPKKDEKKTKPKEDDFAAVLKAVKETAKKEKTEAKDKKEAKDDSAESKSISTKYNAELPMSMSEKDVIMSQLAKCWFPPIGAKDAQDLVVVIDAEYGSDGSYIKVELASESLARYNADGFFRAAADAALRAVKVCSPLKNLPPEKYDTWRVMELRFDPKFMLN